MVSESLVQQTAKILTRIIKTLISPTFTFREDSTDILKQALINLESKCGAISNTRIVDYIVLSAYVFKDRGSKWSLKQMLGQKSIERFNTNQRAMYYEDKWLETGNITKSELLLLFEEYGNDEQYGKFYYLPMEDRTKRRLLNQQAGYMICQTSTLGWSPESEVCKQCDFVEACKQETNNKFPGIYKYRVEHGK